MTTYTLTMYARGMLALAVLGVLTLTGCEAYKQQTKVKALELQARNYVKAVRWSRFEAAAGYIRRREGGLPPPDVSDLDGVRVTNSEMTVSTDRPDSLEAQMTAVFDYYRTDAPSVRSVTQRSTWWWDPLDQAWYLDSDLPEF